jgi:general secretion pathway protein G
MKMEAASESVIMQKTLRSGQVEIDGHGFTLVELLVAVTVLGALVAIAVPWFASYIDKQNVGRAVNDMRVLDNRIQNYKMSNDVYPPSLTDVPQGSLFDPWGRPYNYLQIEGNAKATGQERKDKNLVPINSDFDLYSMGADGKTTAPLTAKNSHDDVVRANNGGYYGLASNY